MVKLYKNWSSIAAFGFTSMVICNSTFSRRKSFEQPPYVTWSSDHTATSNRMWYTILYCCMKEINFL